MKTINALIFGLLMSTSLVYAKELTLEQAKSQGLVRETSSGYIEVTSKGKSSEDASKIVSKTNAGRKEVYNDIAKKLGVDVKKVEKDAGARTKTKAGDQ